MSGEGVDGVGEVMGEMRMELTTGMGGGSGSLVAGGGAGGSGDSDLTSTHVRTV